MNAIILAAGKGERLKSLELNVPKPMIKIQGTPILEHNIMLCKKAGIKNIFINVHYLHNKIIDHLGNGSNFGININYNYEKKLLGTAGALIPFKESLKKNPFFVIYGDNYIDFNLNELKKHSLQKKSDISILFHWRKNIKRSGIAKTNENERIVEFKEKPSSYVSNMNGDWVNAGYYYISHPGIFDYIESNSDFALDLFPNLINLDYRLYALKTNSKLIAVDTPNLFNRLHK